MRRPALRELCGSYAPAADLRADFRGVGRRNILSGRDTGGYV